MHDEDRTRDAYKTARCALDLDGDDDQRHRCHTCGSRVRVLPPADTCPIERRLMALTIAREADPEGLTWALA